MSGPSESEGNGSPLDINIEQSKARDRGPNPLDTSDGNEEEKEVDVVGSSTSSAGIFASTTLKEAVNSSNEHAERVHCLKSEARKTRPDGATHPPGLGLL